MERSNFNRDNISLRSHAGKPLHTYTPTSHENLLKSHLQLDAANEAKRRSDLKRLAAENERLKRELDEARKELENKNKPKEPSVKSYDPNTLYEVDGEPVTLDNLINHFNIILQRHHDLLNHKNKEIQGLKDAIAKTPQKYVPYTRDVEIQSSKPDNEDLQNKLMNEFTNQIVLIRKEYEQVENILTTRNGKLEGLIEDLQEKLSQYSKEIEQLRKEVASRDPQQKVNFEDDIRKVINDKKVAIDKINEIISETKKEPSRKPDLSNLEKDCQTISDDLNNTNNKLNDIKRKLQEFSDPTKDDKINRENAVKDLERLKKQCQEEINILNRQLKNPDDKPFYREIHVSEIPKPHHVNDVVKEDIPKTPSSVNSYKPISEKGPFLSPITSSGLIPEQEPFFRHKHHRFEPCEACNDADWEAALKPEIKVSKKVVPPTPTAMPQPSNRKIIKDFYSPSSQRANPKERGKQQKKKGGCCGKKESEFSNYPYKKNEENKIGNHNSEKLMNTHYPYNMNETPNLLASPEVYRKNVDYENRYR